LALLLRREPCSKSARGTLQGAAAERFVAELNDWLWAAELCRSRVQRGGTCCAERLAARPGGL